MEFELLGVIFPSVYCGILPLKKQKMVRILPSAKARNIVKGLTIGTGGLLISDVTDSFLKVPVKKVQIG